VESLATEGRFRLWSGRGAPCSMVSDVTGRVAAAAKGPLYPNGGKASALPAPIWPVPKPTRSGILKRNRQFERSNRKLGKSMRFAPDWREFPVSIPTVWETPRLSQEADRKAGNRRSRFYLVGFRNNSNSGAALDLLIANHELGSPGETGILGGMRARKGHQISRHLCGNTSKTVRTARMKARAQ
jgi:hypothetical protein